MPIFLIARMLADALIRVKRERVKPRHFGCFFHLYAKISAPITQL
jgi:hypothetical protein